MSEFTGGLQLSKLFYEEAVQPILAGVVPSHAYDAALLGAGSEVLGYDTFISTDHDWGPRLFLFFAERDLQANAGKIDSALRHRLPAAFRGYPTRFTLSHDDQAAPPRHRVEVLSVRGYFSSRLGFDPGPQLSPADWLTVPEQVLLELTAGAVYHAGLGELPVMRGRVAYYPRDIWLYLMASQWQRVAQQEAFVGRTGDVGDDIGSGLIAAAIVQDLMRLCFFIERRYAPYTKWFGTAFSRLACGSALGPLFTRVLRAEEWHAREDALSTAYSALVELHNGLGITAPMEAAVSPYYSRPYRVIHADRVAGALRAAITDPHVRALPAYGGIDQFSDSTDLLGSAGARAALRALYS